MRQATLSRYLSEIYRLLVFIGILSFVSVSLTGLRTKDKAFAFTDSGIQESELEKIQANTLGFWASYFLFWDQLFFHKAGKTQSGEPVLDHIFSRWLPSLHLAIFSISLSALFGFGMVLFSFYSNSIYLEKLTLYSSEFILSTPIFVFAVGFQILFFFIFPILPPGGYDPFDFRTLILPGVTLGMRAYARFSIYLFKEIRTELETPFFYLLQARGYPRFVIYFQNLIWKVLPLSLIFLVIELSALLSGAMIVEEIFFFPGIGRSQFTAIKSMDGNLLQALLFLTGILVYLVTRTTEIVQAKLLGKQAE